MLVDEIVREESFKVARFFRVQLKYENVQGKLFFNS